MLILLGVISSNDFSFSHIPIQEDGRIKPLDSFARNQLLKFYGKTSLAIYENDEKFKINAIDWLVPILIQDINTLNVPIFKIENPDVVEAINLNWREKSTYTYNEVNDGLNYVDDFIDNISLIKSLRSEKRENLELIDRQLVDLSLKRDLFNELYHSASFLIPSIYIDNTNIAKLLQINNNQLISYAHLIIKINNLYQNIEKRSIQEKNNLFQRLGPDFENNPELLSNFILDLLLEEINFDNLLYQSTILKIFPVNDNSNEWLSPNTLVENNLISEYKNLVIPIENIFKSYISQRPMNQRSIKNYQSIINNDYNVNTKILVREVNYNKASLFYWSLIFYILSLISLVTLIIIKNSNSSLKILPFILLIIGFLYNTAGLIIRMNILNRPPVSTLYESIIFVAFISVLLAIILEFIKKDNISLFVGSISGIVLHYISFGYAADGDTFGVLVAVLNSNFWLATHVTTITTGYGTTIIASLVGHIYLLQDFFKSDKKTLKSTYNIMLATTFIALFFTMFGTILGGIWGDQSWGRFWGWDPKENGALLIVMWLLMMLHLKLSGWVKGPGYAYGLVLANITVALAWFGVNLLSVGLHNYGFTEGAAMNLLVFILFELFFGTFLYLKIKFRKIN